MSSLRPATWRPGRHLSQATLELLEEPARARPWSPCPGSRKTSPCFPLGDGPRRVGLGYLVDGI